MRDVMLGLGFLFIGIGIGKELPLKLSNGDYQTDNGPIIRIPGLPPHYEINSIFMTDFEHTTGIVRCVEFAEPGRRVVGR
jgi:hypothetical protein